MGCGRARGAERGAATSCVAALVHFTSEDGLQGALSGYDYEVALHAFTCATLALLRATLAFFVQP